MPSRESFKDTNYIFDNSNDKSKKNVTILILKGLHSNLEITLKNLEYKIKEIRNKNNIVEMK